MGNGRPLAFFLAKLLVVLALATPVHGAPLDAGITATGTMALVGHVELSVFSTAVEWTRGEAREVLQVRDATLHAYYLNDPLLEFIVATPVDLITTNQPLPTETDEEFDFHGNLSIDASSDESYIAMLAAPGIDLVTFHNRTSRMVGSLQNEASIAQDFRPSFHGRRLEHAEPAIEMPSSPTGLAGGRAVVIIYGAVAQFSGTQSDAYATGPERCSCPEFAGTSVMRIDRRYLVLELERGDVAFAPEGWSDYAREISGSVQGEIALTGATAQGTLDGGILDTEAALFQAHGQLDFTATAEEDGAKWRVSGDIRGLSLDGMPRYVASAAAVAAGVAIGAIAVVLLAWKALTAPLSLVGGYNQAKPLENRNRLRVLAEIQNAPGLTRADLANRTGLSRPTVNFHLNVLLRHSLIAATRRGRIENYATAGMAEHQARRIALAANPVRRQILAHLAASHMITAAAMRKQWAGTPPAWAVLHHHINVLAKWGIISRGLQGSRVWAAIKGGPEARWTRPKNWQVPPATSESMR